METTLTTKNTEGERGVDFGSTPAPAGDATSNVAAPNTSPEVFRVRASHLSFIEEKLNGLRKRAIKLGLEPPVLTVHGRVQVESGKTSLGFPRLVEVADISVTGAAPRLAGWTFCATLQKIENEVLVRTVPGQEIPVTFHKADPQFCGHCNLSRRRNDTFVLRHDDGAFKQVGRNCLADFLNTTSPEAVAKYADALASLRALLEAKDPNDGGWGSSYEVYSLRLGDFLSVTATVARRHGFVTRSAARNEGRESTANRVWDVFFPPKPTKHNGEQLDALAEDRTDQRDEDTQLAVDAVRWIEELPETTDESDYIHNLRVIVNHGIVDWKLAGYAASLISAYQREQDKNRPVNVVDATRKASEWFGTPKKREVFTLRYDGAGVFTSAYGDGYVYHFLDPAGNKAVWFTTTSCPVSNPDGSHTSFDMKTYRVKATVQAHDEFRGEKVTKLTRCAVLDLVS